VSLLNRNFNQNHDFNCTVNPTRYEHKYICILAVTTLMMAM